MSSPVPLARSRLLRALLLGAGLLLNQAPSQAFDLFRTEQRIAKLPQQASGAAADENPCRFEPPTGVLELLEAVERALCHSPETRAAWAQARVQAAMLGVARAAYLPNAAGSLAYTEQKSRADYEKPYDMLDSNNRPRTRSANLKMSWTVADAGLRSANAEKANALVDAANATHDQTLQRLFLETAQRYFDVQSALAVLKATQEAERVAQRSVDATAAKHAAGVGALTDKLQAAVALSDARLKRVTAEGDLKNAEGALATVIGLSPNQVLQLPSRSNDLPDTQFVRPIEHLFEEARTHHPALLAIKAERQAAQAQIEAVAAEGLPSLVLSAEANVRNQDKNIPITGYPPTGARFNDSAIGLQLNVPIFEGFGRQYRIRAANAQAEQKEAEQARIEQQVMLEIWKSYQALNTRHEHIEAARLLLDSAGRSFAVAEGRYRAGVGNILELLNAQSAVASAEQRRIEALSGWLTARLQLAASIGRLGMWAIR